MLDIFLPDIEGWRVLARLKNDVNTRHIPVHVISTDEARERALDSGARRFIAKPMQSRKAVDEVLAEVYELHAPATGASCCWSSRTRRGLATLTEYLGGLENVDIISATDGPRAARAACARASSTARCVEPRHAGLRPGAGARGGARAPCLAGPGDRLRALSSRARWAPRNVAHARPHPGRARGAFARAAAGPGALFACTSTSATLPEAQPQGAGATCYGSTKALAGKRVLIVDDDIRNIFALARVLEEHDMEIVSAENGRDAIAQLGQRSGRSTSC